MIRTGRLPSKILLILKTASRTIEELMVLTNQGNKRWVVFNALQNLIKSHRVSVENNLYCITAVGSSEFDKKEKQSVIVKKNTFDLVPSRTAPEFKPMIGYESAMLCAAQTRENSLQRYHVTESGVSALANDQGLDQL